MKRIRKSKAARAISWLLTVTMIAPIFLGLLGPLSARAQGTATGTVQTVIVIEGEFLFSKSKTK